MSSWIDVHKSGSNGDAAARMIALMKHFAENRNLLSCVCGYDLTTEKVFGQCKVTLFYEMGHVKLCVNDTLGKRLGFVTLDPEDGTLSDAIEAALVAGIEWREAKTEKNWAGQATRR